jgi:hypothetical protein
MFGVPSCPSIVILAIDKPKAIGGFLGKTTGDASRVTSYGGLAPEWKARANDRPLRERETAE